tara:strand:- start:4292 stop:5110 length:819 start_codon:yes stop_codon:yes gene_type:complete
MLSIILMGGLGNQLFQIFTAIAYSMRYKTEIKLPINKPDITTRPHYWNTFLRNLKPILTNNPPIHFTNLYEYSHEYTEIEYIPVNFTLRGYYQSYKYFEEEYENICKLIQLEEQKDEVKKKIDFDISDCVSLHFRIGDYKNIQDCHPIMPINYYYNSINNIINETGKIDWKILYFYEKQDTEDVNNFINVLQNKYPSMEFISVNHTFHDYEQMLLMSMCSHNIIANSTYSWWGAYFNSNKEKTVCYPYKWFGPSLDKNVKDMFPSHWIKINY